MIDFPDALPQRRKEADCADLFVRRWSPRAMSGVAVPPDVLLRLFEAARWAPSSYNGQPWRFLYAVRDTPHWLTLFGLMGEFNQGWCARAGALVVIVSRKQFEHNGQPSITHSYDAGAAWENFALQGSMLGLVVHGMQGFDYDKARRDLHVPEPFQVEAMAAVGYPGDPATLDESLRQREQPSDRKPLSEIVFEGRFPG